MPTPYWRGCRAPTCTCTERSGFSHKGRHARRSAWGSSLSSYPAGSPRTLRFSRGCPYRATDARQVAGDACHNPVGSRAAIRLKRRRSIHEWCAVSRPAREGHITDGRRTSRSLTVFLGKLETSLLAEDSEENRPIDID